jgi:hypothetical protein
MATRGEGNQRLRPMTERCEHGIPAAVDGHFYAGIGELPGLDVVDQQRRLSLGGKIEITRPADMPGCRDN